MPSLPPIDRSSPVDDADALPAVGKVWDEGPKRSLSEIMAAANRQRAAANPPPPKPIAKHVPADLQELWKAVLQQVQEKLGPGVHVPLSSGAIRKEDAQITIRFSGPFAAMARYLDKHRDAVQQMFCEASGTALSLKFEIDQSAPTPAAAPAPDVPQASQSPHNAAPLPVPAGREGIPITPELRTQLEQDPLIRAVMETLNGTIVKVEQ